MVALSFLFVSRDVNPINNNCKENQDWAYVITFAGVYSQFFFFFFRIEGCLLMLMPCNVQARVFILYLIDKEKLLASLALELMPHTYNFWVLFFQNKLHT